MKKVYMFLVVLALMFVSEAKAQINFGIKGGLNVTDMSLSNDVLKSSNRTGFYIGPTVKFTLPVVGLGIDASALYDHRSAKVEARSSKSPSPLTCAMVSAWATWPACSFSPARNLVSMWVEISMRSTGSGRSPISVST